MLLLGCLAFLLMLVSDWNDARLHQKLLLGCFPVGVLLLVVSIIAMTVRGTPPFETVYVRLPAWLFFIIFLLLELYSLFFALPLSTSYTQPGTDRGLCDAGVYTLCRHPGVLWFGPMCFCLWVAAGFPLTAVLLFTALDLALAFFEDICVFPLRLEGYNEYKQQVPFLIPTRQSIQRCMHCYFSRKV